MRDEQRLRRQGLRRAGLATSSRDCDEGGRREMSRRSVLDMHASDGLRENRGEDFSCDRHLRSRLRSIRVREDDSGDASIVDAGEGLTAEEAVSQTTASGDRHRRELIPSRRHITQSTHAWSRRVLVLVHDDVPVAVRLPPREAPHQPSWDGRESSSGVSAHASPQRQRA
jgi:hypothetical protein